MGSRGQSGRDRDAGDIVGQYSLEGIGESKAKILSFFREMDHTSEGRVEDAFREKAEELAEDLSDRMVYRDDDARSEFNEIRRTIGGTTFTLSDKDRSNIPDFNKYIRSNENFLKIGKRGLPIDSAYEELTTLFPARFPRNITNPADQLQHINSVLGNLRAGRVIAASSDEKESAVPYIYDDLARAYNAIRRRQGKKILNFGEYTRRRSNSGGRYDFNDEDELPFF